MFVSLTKHLPFFAALACGVALPAADGPPPSLPRVHDPSAIHRVGGLHWFFSTGPGIVSHRSDDLRTWTVGPPVFTTPPAWADREIPGNKGRFWAPEVVQVGGRYLLYYSVSTFGKNHSAIALATNITLDPADPRFAWKDEGIVLRSLAEDNFNAIDPALNVTPDGKLWMSFGSFWSGLKLVELDPGTGKLKHPGDRKKQRSAPERLHSLAHAPEIEAPAILLHEGRYYLFANHGLCCKGLESTYRIVVGRSDKITGPYLDARGAPMMSGGGTLLLGSEGRFHGPGHAGFFQQDGVTLMGFHFYDRDNRGQPAFAHRRLSWNKDGWPVVE